MMPSRIFIQSLKVTALIAALASVLPLLAQDLNLSAADIQARWVGKTVVVVPAAGPLMGKTLLLQLKANGYALLSGAFQDTGVWRLSDQGYCVAWTKIRGGEEGCQTVVVKAGQTQVINANGSLNSTVTEVR